MDTAAQLVAHMKDLTLEERVMIAMQLVDEADESVRMRLIEHTVRRLEPQNRIVVAKSVANAISEEDQPIRDIAKLDVTHVWPEFNSGLSLMPHQKTAVDWLLRMFAKPRLGISGGLCCLEMGLGKTVIALSAIAMLGLKGPSIYICDKTLLRTAGGDVKKFFGDRLRPVICHSDYIGKHGVATLDASRYGLVITTYDVVYQMHKSGSKVLSGVPWVVAVADESQRLRNVDNKTYESMMTIRAHHHVCLTGTPIVNGAEDLHGQLKWMGLSDSIPYDKNSFISLNLIGFTLSMTKDAELGMNLPPITFTTVAVTLSEPENMLRLLLTERTKTVVATLLNEKGRSKANKTLRYTDVLITIMRLRLACNSPFLLTSESKVRGDPEEVDTVLRDEVVLPSDAQDHVGWNKWISSPEHGMRSSKMNAVIELLRSFPADEKVLIFSQWVSSLMLLRRRIAAEGANMPMITGETADINAVLGAFSAGTDRFLGLTYGVGSKGLNITCASRVIILEPGWNRTHEQQASARVHRIGQTRPVQVYVMCCMPKSIETFMNEKCDKKEQGTKDFLGEGVEGFSQFIEWTKA